MARVIVVARIDLGGAAGRGHADGRADDRGWRSAGYRPVTVYYVDGRYYDRWDDRYRGRNVRQVTSTSVAAGITATGTTTATTAGTTATARTTATTRDDHYDRNDRNDRYDDRDGRSDRRDDRGRYDHLMRARRYSLNGLVPGGAVQLYPVMHPARDHHLPIDPDAYRHASRPGAGSS